MRRLTLATCAVLLLLLAACGGDDDDADDAETDPVAAAQQRVADAETALDDAQAALEDARGALCDASSDYIDSVDRYGQVFTQAAVTVGDVNTAGADLEEPRETVESSAGDVQSAKDDVASAEQELADARAALEEAETGTSAPPEETTTTLPLVPEATVSRVEQAEEDLATAFSGVSETTPLVEATQQVNAAAFALQVAWLRLFADAGCLDDEQQAQAVEAVATYTVALQASLITAGYLEGEADGIYGPATVDAVERLQQDNGLPVTGLVDRATAQALEDAVAAVGGVAAQQAVAHTAAVQSALALAGYWTGPIDGQWTDALTAALQAMQTDLGVPATGVMDAATLAALQEAIAELRTPATTTTEEPATTTTEAEDGSTESDSTEETTGTSVG